MARKQIFLRDTSALPLLGAELYASNGPDPTPLRRSSHPPVECSYVSSGFLPENCVGNEECERI
eukprot:10214811-Karenia_brevis.AAC.1